MVELSYNEDFELEVSSDESVVVFTSLHTWVMLPFGNDNNDD